MSQPAITAEPQHAPPETDDSSETLLPITVRLSDGREVDRAYPPRFHRELHLDFLHSDSRGYVEVAAGRRDRKGKLHIYTREWRDHFVPAARNGEANWRDAALALADRHLARGDELFLGVAPRTLPDGNKPAVQWSQWLWVDVDGDEHLGRLEALLARKPAHLLVESAGSGGLHAYWRLAEPLPARKIRCPDSRIIENPLEVREITDGRSELVGYRELATKEVIKDARKVDSIERANKRLINALGYVTKDDKLVGVGDGVCFEQARVLRWAGSENGKTGRFARIVHVDFWLPPYRPAFLLGDLADPKGYRPVKRQDLRRIKYDAYRLIPAAVYFPILAHVQLPERGNINCPSPLHEDVVASMSVDAYVFCCHGCGAHGTIYDLASLMQRGPTGDALADDTTAFGRAKQAVKDACSDLL
jgi:hypothetical protein